VRPTGTKCVRSPYALSYSCIRRSILEGYRKVQTRFRCRAFRLGRLRLLFARVWEQIAPAVAGSENYCDGDGLDNSVNRSAWTHSIVVVEKTRGRGIACEMIRFCEQRAADLGYDSVKCFVKTNNGSSIRLHERFGFIRAEKVRDHYLYVKLLCEDHGELTVSPKSR